jgi:hypothetical protein
MDPQMKKRGRPLKNGVTEPWRFVRALMVINAYTKARARGEKHSASIIEAVEFVRQLHPEMPISVTGAKRVLAEFLPQEGPIALRVDYSILEGEEAAKLRNFNAQRLRLVGTKCAMELTDRNTQRPLKRFRFGFGARPNYPRHNANSSRT